MHLAQFLMRQGWSKVRIARFQQIQSLLGDFLIQPLIAGLTTPLADQASGSLTLVDPPQPFDLPHTQVQQVGGFFLCQPLFLQSLHNFQTCQFLCTHGNQFVHFLSLQ